MNGVTKIKAIAGVLLYVLVLPVKIAAAATPDMVDVQATAQVNYSADTGLYTYSYSFKNVATSPLPVSNVMIAVKGSIINVSTPTGWTGMVWQSGDVIDFAATKVEEAPPDYVDDGKLVPSPYQIKPGDSLGGFTFQSPDPPDFTTFYAQGFTQLPVLDVDVPDPEEDVPPPTVFDQSFKGTTKGPFYSDDLFLGGRRPSVDGFLAFWNIVNRDVKPTPVQIDIEFGVNGETVNQASFKATLNNLDVTADFKVTGANTRRAIFDSSHPAMKAGRNVLLTQVKGIIPGTTRNATDVDRVGFTVQ